MLKRKKEQLEVIARIPLDKRALTLLSYLMENSKDGIEVQILARPGSNPVAYQRTLSEKEEIHGAALNFKFRRANK